MAAKTAKWKGPLKGKVVYASDDRGEGSESADNRIAMHRIFFSQLAAFLPSRFPSFIASGRVGPGSDYHNETNFPPPPPPPSPLAKRATFRSFVFIILGFATPLF